MLHRTHNWYAVQGREADQSGTSHGPDGLQPATLLDTVQLSVSGHGTHHREQQFRLVAHWVAMVTRIHHTHKTESSPALDRDYVRQACRILMECLHLLAFGLRAVIVAKWEERKLQH